MSFNQTERKFRLIRPSSTTNHSIPSRFVHLSKLASLAVLLALAMPAVGGCSGAGSNPLIGSWKFVNTTDKAGATGCNSNFVFTDKMAMITTPPSSVIPGGSVRSMAVTYVASATLVSGMTNAAGHVNYTFADKNHMYTEDAWGRCNYERVN